ncbi:cupin domain-containing protein [Alkalihalobacterium bogoriense]|uniref:cupin domain-containing protein n=1 Tax=Alkalihalobacterium bogoriense TaxID=246272 RepID=UPI000479511C|nr:cupin domain-containing protein [Alkalihalobacterium bogoriense]
MIGQWEVVDTGVKRKIHPPGNQLMMMEVEFEAGAVGALHYHHHEQYTYCIEGVFEFEVDGKKVKLQQGDTLYIPGGALHGVVAIEKGKLIDTFTPVREDLLDS